MAMTVLLSEVITPEILEHHTQHIVDFLEQEGITFDPENIGATNMNERQVKELLEELAEGAQ